MSRQVVIDTETTGLEVSEGHKVIEVGCIEIVDRFLSGKQLHIYINPEREIDSRAFAVHGISSEFLRDKPIFASVADEVKQFIADAEIIAHNANFDMGFLRAEFAACGYDDIFAHNSVVDTLAVARQKFPGVRNNLDALCKRFEIDNSKRDLHGALMDADLLAKVYLLMTGGQETMLMDDEEKPSNTHDLQLEDLVVVYASAEEQEIHERICQDIMTKDCTKIKAVEASEGGNMQDEVPDDLDDIVSASASINEH